MRRFHLFSLFTLAVGVVLIWWGAAVTTEDVGLAVPDWPLSFGKLNPKGWWWVPALRLEHGHRSIATLVGLLVLSQYLWQLGQCRASFVEAILIFLIGVGYLYLVYHGALGLAGVILVMSLIWIVTAWIGQRWTLLRGLTTAALLLVVFQASLGGQRVLGMSDSYGISHGTAAHLFFCVLVLIAYASSQTWKEGRLNLTGGARFWARLGSCALFLAVFAQLVIGAILRHTQRQYLAAPDILTTKGVLLPPTQPFDVFILFLHKYWGFSVAALLIVVALQARHWLRDVPALRLIPRGLLVLPVAQVVLGIYVILTGKSFWVTNFHVLNGLGLMVLSFLLMVSIWASTTGLGLVGQAEADKSPTVA